MTVIIPSNLLDISNTFRDLDIQTVNLADHYGFALISQDNIVKKCIIADFDFIEYLSNQEGLDCILFLSLTNYSRETNPGAFCNPGFIWDSENEVFYEPQPFPSWILNTETWVWKSPIPYPNDGNQYIWNEETLSWREKILQFTEYNTNLNKN